MARDERFVPSCTTARTLHGEVTSFLSPLFVIFVICPLQPFLGRNGSPLGSHMCHVLEESINSCLVG